MFCYESEDPPFITTSSFSSSSSPSSSSSNNVSPILFTREDEELLVSVMNSNIPVEQGNYWFPVNQSDRLNSFDSMLATEIDSVGQHPNNNAINNNDNNQVQPERDISLERKKAAQSQASKRYRERKKANSDQLTIENENLKKEITISKLQLETLQKQVSVLQEELSKARVSLQSAKIAQNVQQTNNKNKNNNNNNTTTTREATLEQIDIITRDLTTTLELLQQGLQICLDKKLRLTETYANPLLFSTIKVHLEQAQRLVLHHHKVGSELAQRNLSPYLHAYWSLFEPPHSTNAPIHIEPEECAFAVADTNNEWWREFAMNADATQQQLNDISTLQRRYCQTITRIKKERYQYSLQIREFYWNRVYRIQLRFPGPSKADTSNSTFQVAQAQLLSQLQLLKHNIDEEQDLLSDTYTELSRVLSPLQEAILLVSLFTEAKSHLFHFHSVHQIWERMGNNQIDAEAHDHGCSIM